MEEAELEKQRNMVTRSSIKRKPFANLTNIVRKPYPISPFSQSKRPGSSTASDSSIGSTQNPNHENHPLISSPDQPLLSTPPTLTPARLVGDEISYTQRRSTRKTLLKVKADVPFYQTSSQETRSKTKELSVPLCSSTLGNRNQSSIQKTTYDGNKTFMAPNCFSVEKIKDKQKAIDVSSSAHHMKNTKNIMDTPLFHSTMKIKDKGKENAVQSSYPHLENTNINLSHSSMKRKDKGKSIAVPFNYPPMKTKMMEVLAPSSGVNIKEKGERVTGSSTHFDHSQKDERNVVVTPLYHRTLKKNKESSCPPLLRTAINRNQGDESEDTFQSKLQTEPPPNKKKRCSSKESGEEYVLPQEFVEQQRAYFKEIDDFELEVEEV